MGKSRGEWKKDAPAHHRAFAGSPLDSSPPASRQIHKEGLTLLVIAWAGPRLPIWVEEAAAIFTITIITGGASNANLIVVAACLPGQRIVPALTAKCWSQLVLTGELGLSRISCTRDSINDHKILSLCLADTR